MKYIYFLILVEMFLFINYVVSRWFTAGLDYTLWLLHRVDVGSVTDVSELGEGIM
jgi:hypothetical protein